MISQEKNYKDYDSEKAEKGIGLCPFLLFGEIGKKLKQKSFSLLTQSGDGILYHERVFPGGEGDKDSLHSDRGAACRAGKRGAGRMDSVAKFIELARVG